MVMFVRFFLFVVVFAVALRAAETCSLHVDVFYNNLERIYTAVPVKLVDVDGSIIESLAGSTGVDFCELGEGPVTVIVGSSRCESRVTNVRLHMNITTAISIVHDMDPCLTEVWSGVGCTYIFRAVNEEGRSFGQVSMRVHGSVEDLSLTDRLGRTIFKLLPGMSASVSLISLDSKFEGKLDIACPAARLRQEFKVKMFKR